MKKIALALCFLLSASVAYSATPQNSKRIISAGSSVTELIVALGARDQLIGVDLTSRKFNSDDSLPQVGYHRQLSAEGLLSLTPTHLIGSEEMGPESTLTLLRNSNVDVEIVPAGDTEHDLLARIERIASITGKQGAAEILKKDVDKKMGQLRSQALARSPSVLFAMLTKGRPATIAGDKTTIDTIISLAGGQNPAKHDIQSYKPLSNEAIVKMQPEFLLVSQRAWQTLGGEAGIISAFPLLSATPAAQAHRIIPISSSAIIGGFGLESIALTEQLYNTFKAAE